MYLWCAVIAYKKENEGDRDVARRLEVASTVVSAFGVVVGIVVIFVVILTVHDVDVVQLFTNRVSSSLISLNIITAQCTLVYLRGLAIACRLSVCPSVRLSVTLVICDHIDWKSWKLIEWAISPTSSLFAAKRRSTYSQGNMEKFWGD